MSATLIVGLGYVGEAYAKAVAARGERCIGLSRTAGRSSPYATLLHGDVNDPRTLLQILPHDIRRVVYAVSADSYDAVAYRKAYNIGLRSVLSHLKERSAEIERFIFLSSTRVYSESSGDWIDEDSPTDDHNFAAAELLAGEEQTHSAPFSTIVLRLAGIYGPGRAELYRRLLDSGEINLPNGDQDGYTNRVHVDDIVGALIHLMTLERPNSIYNCTDSRPCRRSELLTWLAGWGGVPLVAADENRSNLSQSFLVRKKSTPAGAGKRCSNRRLLDSGYTLSYPSYVEGLPNALSSVYTVPR